MFILVILQQFVINLASKLSRSNENMPLNNVTSYLFYTVFSINEGLKTQKKKDLKMDFMMEPRQSLHQD